jgi:hypothetical protein
MSFDWVKARAACSRQVVFKELELGARNDVASIREERPDSAGEFEFLVTDGGFSVMRQGKMRAESIDFTLEGESISARDPRPGGTSITATLTLNDKGDCCLKVGNQELEQWQFRRKALETLFFDKGADNRMGGPR